MTLPTKAQQFSSRIGASESSWWEQSESEIQKNNHRRLRELAIAHLASSKQPVAAAFRGEHYAALGVNFKGFLSEQGKVSAWATDIEASALAELFKVTLVVTTIKKNGQMQKPFCLYRADGDAPVIEIYNRDNQHWFVNSKTQGEGNCFYNAFAQGLQRVVKRTDPKPAISNPEASKNHEWKLFKDVKPSDVIAHQQAIASAIAKTPTASTLAFEFKKEQQRIRNLPQAEQIQIAKDHELALKLARQEMFAPKLAWHRNTSEKSTRENSFSATAS